MRQAGGQPHTRLGLCRAEGTVLAHPLLALTAAPPLLPSALSLAQVFGGHVVRAPCGVMHGKTSPVWHTGVGLLEGVASPFNVARYHSLVIDKDTCPPELEVGAASGRGEEGWVWVRGAERRPAGE